MARVNPAKHKKVSAAGGKLVSKNKTHMKRISALGVAARKKNQKTK